MKETKQSKGQNSSNTCIKRTTLFKDKLVVFVREVVPVSKKSSSYMKLLTKRSVDYFVQQSHDFWKETLLLSFSNVFFGG